MLRHRVTYGRLALACALAAIVSVFGGLGVALADEAEEKVCVPVVDKQVLEDSTGAWSHVADAAFGDVVRYRITSTMPDNLDEYDTYEWWVVDWPDDAEAMAIDESSVTATLVDASGARTDITERLSVSVGDGSMRVGTPDVRRAVEGIASTDVIEVEYEAKISSRAGVGMDGSNDNFCHVVHTARDGSGMSTTPDVRARVLVWAMSLSKVSATDGRALANAIFELRDASGGVVATFTTDGRGRAHVDGIDSGEYRLVETRAPVGFEAVDDVRLTISPSMSDGGAAALAAHARGADVSSTDVRRGVVGLTVVDSESATHVPDRPDTEDMPKTSDALTVLGMVLVAGGIGAAAFGISLSRRKSTYEDR